MAGKSGFYKYPVHVWGRKRLSILELTLTHDSSRDDAGYLIPTSAGASHLSVGATSVSPSTTTNIEACLSPGTRLQLSDPPYEDYFYSDCHLSTQVVVTSPLSDSNLTFIGPRLLVSRSY